jgi:hypothetical protein
VERAPQLRTGEYALDFWDLGFDVAEKMGILPDLRRDGAAASCPPENVHVESSNPPASRVDDAQFESRASASPALRVTAAFSVFSTTHPTAHQHSERRF